MSFDIFLQRFQNGEPAEAPRAAVRQVLARQEHEAGNFGFYIVAFSDGVQVEFSASGLNSDESFCGCAFHVRGFGQELAQFMCDIASAGDMVMFPAMEGNPIILIREDQKRHVPPDILENFPPIVVANGVELQKVLAEGHDAWSAYRDRVVGDGGPAGENH